MGTKLLYAINLLATSQSSSRLTLNCMDDRDHFQDKILKKSQRTGLDRLEDSMDRMLEQHNIESVKKMMLTHEEIFRYQVRELHRLYSVQKMLMDEMKSEIKRTRYWSTSSSTEINRSDFIDHCHTTTQGTSGHNLHVQSVRADPRFREHSSSCSADNLRMLRCFDLERPADEDISAGVSATEEEQAGPSVLRPSTNIKMINDGSDVETEVELTLSIGGSCSKKRSKNQQPCHSLELGCSESSTHHEIKQPSPSASIKCDRGEECSDLINTVSSSSTALDQDQGKQPHWLFQGLSINRT